MNRVCSGFELLQELLCTLNNAVLQVLVSRNYLLRCCATSCRSAWRGVTDRCEPRDHKTLLLRALHAQQEVQYNHRAQTMQCKLSWFCNPVSGLPGFW